MNVWQATPGLCHVPPRHRRSLLSTFDDTNDSLARRTRRVDNDAVTNAFGYNLRSEVTSAAMGTNQYGYAYDPIGNREWARINANTNIYLSNPLNQYTNILVSVPSALSAVNPQYDLDGNMLALRSLGEGGTTNGAWSYAWDAENRLTRADDGTNVIVYAYDFMSRRVARTQYRRIAENAYETLNTRAFLYDGWNVIQDRTHSQTHTLTNSYLWGLDLSGTFQGAGGIGGLVAASLNGTNVVYGYDANGHLTDLVDTNGTLVAHYEYDPFGRAVVAEGAMATVNLFRFSTKHWDDATGLGYWGFRWYDPVMGRWISRDPLQNADGPNEIAKLMNDDVNRIDRLGLTSMPLGNTDPQRIRDCDAALKNLLKERKIGEEIDKRVKKGCYPRLQCACCPERKGEGGGCSVYGEAPTKVEMRIFAPAIGADIIVPKGSKIYDVFVCANLVDNYATTFYHEIQHYLDGCDDYNPPGPRLLICYSLLCGEMRAAKREGKCVSTMSCAAYVLSADYWWNDYKCDEDLYPKGVVTRADKKKHMRSHLEKCDVSDITTWTSLAGAP